MSVALWDQSVFDAALAERLKYAGRTVRQTVVTAAYWIAVNAKGGTPFVPIARIDTELAVQMVPGVTLKGNPSKAKKNRVAVSGPGGASRTEGVSLALMIVLARANLTKQGRATGQSNYNASTNNRYALSPGALAGKGTIRNLISRMIKSRHSSPHFLQVGWNPVIRGLLGNPDLVNKYRRGGGDDSDRGKKWNTWNDTELGGVTVDLGPLDCSVTIENDVGGDGTNEKSHRKALFLYAVPAFQRALNRETAGFMEYMDKHSKVGDDAFNAAMR